MIFRSIMILAFLISSQFSVAAESPFISIHIKNGRPLFHSKKFGDFFSLGSNSFMESASNSDMKRFLKEKDFGKIYEEQLQSYISFGFNSLGGWSNTEYLNARLPYAFVLFDDELFPRNHPLLTCRGTNLPSGDAEPLPNPVNDPFDPDYLKGVQTYLSQVIGKKVSDPALMLYWIGHEFGIGGSDYFDLRPYTYSPAIKKEFQIWLKKKYLRISSLNQEWKIHETSFEKVTEKCPGTGVSEGIDRKEFMSIVLRKWFSLITSEIRKIDPHHLISSPKISVWDHHPQLDLVEKNGHYEAMAGLFDIISVDWYSSNNEFSEKSINQITSVAKKLNLPILVAEFGTRQEIKGWTNTPGAKTLLQSQLERGERYHSQVMQLFDNKNFIGAHWFRWQDHMTKTDQMNKGLVQVSKNKIRPYRDLETMIVKTHLEINEKLKAQK